MEATFPPLTLLLSVTVLLLGRTSSVDALKCILCWNSLAASCERDYQKGAKECAVLDFEDNRQEARCLTEQEVKDGKYKFGAAGWIMCGAVDGCNSGLIQDHLNYTGPENEPTTTTTTKRSASSSRASSSSYAGASLVNVVLALAVSVGVLLV